MRYLISHSAKAMLSDDFVIDETVYIVDEAECLLTEAHAKALEDIDNSDIDLYDLASSIFECEKPDWMHEDETIGTFEMKIFIGDTPLDEYDATAWNEKNPGRDLDDELTSGNALLSSGSTDNVFIERI